MEREGWPRVTSLELRKLEYGGLADPNWWVGVFSLGQAVRLLFLSVSHFSISELTRWEVFFLVLSSVLPTVNRRGQK